MKKNIRIILCILLLILIVYGGTVGYMVLENYNWLQALYMTIITISTVGYGEVKPLSDAGRIFSCFLILGGFATMALTASTIAAFVFEKVMSSISENRKMRKQISLMEAHCIICGYGRVGSAAAESLHKQGADFVIIEADSEQTEKIVNDGFLVVQGDCTDEKVLLEANIKTASGLLALVSSDPDNLFITLTARELNPTLYIIARAVEAASERKLLQAGADKVISPFDSAGRQVADGIIAATRKETKMQESDQYNNVAPKWIGVREGSSMEGQTIAVVADEMGRQVIGLRRGDKDILYPDKEHQLCCGDSLLVIENNAATKDESMIAKEQPKRVLIVDDNPVIVGLYARLLSKAGFIPLTATDGAGALKKIEEEHPDAAVLDFMLPVLSGIEICQRVKQDSNNGNTKLILFTSDDHPKTRERALEAGADEFVLKSAESSDLIKAVVRILNG